MKKTTVAVLTLASFVAGSTALATMEMQKKYKEKDPKANCATCHTEKMPKKDSAGLNDFGKKYKEEQDAAKKAPEKKG